MIRTHLLELIGKKHWTAQAKLAKVTGIRPTTISELAREIATSITIDNLDLICEALDCQPGDIFTYEPNKVPRIEKNQRGDPIRPVND